MSEALNAFAGELDDSCLVVCEATGGYEDLLLDALLLHAIPAHRADARKVKAFIRSFGSSVKPTPSTPGRWLAMRTNARASLFVGERAIPIARLCRRSC